MTDDRPGAALLRLVAVMDTLRVSCPWDARQTHESLAPHLLEECYEALDALESGDPAAHEALDALESGDPAAFRDELGDVLLQVVFHARIAAEAADGTGYTIDDVAEGIVAKLIRRHPHVFADVTVSGPEEVKRNWDAIKAAERAEAAGAPVSVLDTVPFGQPALSLAAQLQRRAERARGCHRAEPAARPGRPASRHPAAARRRTPGAAAGGSGRGPGRQRHRRRAVRAGGQGPRGRPRPRTRAPRGGPGLPRPRPCLGTLRARLAHQPAALRRQSLHLRCWTPTRHVSRIFAAKPGRLT